MRWRTVRRVAATASARLAAPVTVGAVAEPMQSGMMFSFNVTRDERGPR